MQSFTGVVAEGSRRATILGYPTINIRLDGAPEDGIYASVVRVDEAAHHAAAFVDSTRQLLEAHILDFSGVLYGREVSIELVHKIRETQYFDNDDALRDAIREDIAKVREYFKN